MKLNSSFWVVVVLACCLLGWALLLRHAGGKQANLQAEVQEHMLADPLYHAYVLELYGRAALARGERTGDARALDVGNVLIDMANAARTYHASNLLRGAEVPIRYTTLTNIEFDYGTD